MKFVSRILFGLLLASARSVAAVAQTAADFPSRPVKFVVPFAAGGPTDVVARISGRPLVRPLEGPVGGDREPFRHHRGDGSLDARTDRPLEGDRRRGEHHGGLMATPSRQIACSTQAAVAAIR